MLWGSPDEIKVKQSHTKEIYSITERSEISFSYESKYIQIFTQLFGDDMSIPTISIIVEFIGPENVHTEFVHWAAPTQKQHHFHHD